MESSTTSKKVDESKADKTGNKDETDSAKKRKKDATTAEVEKDKVEKKAKVAKAADSSSKDNTKKSEKVKATGEGDTKTKKVEESKEDKNSNKDGKDAKHRKKDAPTAEDDKAKVEKKDAQDTKAATSSSTVDTNRSQKVDTKKNHKEAPQQVTPILDEYLPGAVIDDDVLLQCQEWVSKMEESELEQAIGEAKKHPDLELYIQAVRQETCITDPAEWTCFEDEPAEDLIHFHAWVTCFRKAATIELKEPAKTKQKKAEKVQEQQQVDRKRARNDKTPLPRAPEKKAKKSVSVAGSDEESDVSEQVGLTV